MSAGSGLCRAQRITPFILQAIFNLVLYAIAQVTLVVINFKLDARRRRRLDLLLVLYCLGVPVLCLIIHLYLDQLSLTLRIAVNQLTRDAVICVPRYETAAIEVSLIFLPYIVVALSLRIFRYLRTVQKQVAWLQSHSTQKSGSNTSLNLLLVRLGALGVLTFIVLIVLMAVTGFVMVRNDEYGTNFYNWYACETAGRSCETCEVKKALMDASRVPRPPALHDVLHRPSIWLLLCGSIRFTLV